MTAHVLTGPQVKNVVLQQGPAILCARPVERSIRHVASCLSVPRLFIGDEGFISAHHHLNQHLQTPGEGNHLQHGNRCDASPDSDVAPVDLRLWLRLARGERAPQVSRASAHVASDLQVALRRFRRTRSEVVELQTFAKHGAVLEFIHEGDPFVVRLH